MFQLILRLTKTQNVEKFMNYAMWGNSFLEASYFSTIINALLLWSKYMFYKNLTDSDTAKVLTHFTKKNFK